MTQKAQMDKQNVESAKREADILIGKFERIFYKYVSPFVAYVLC
jgi:hypothetical protein